MYSFIYLLRTYLYTVDSYASKLFCPSALLQHYIVTYDKMREI